MRRDLDDRRQRLRDCGALEKHGTPVYVFFEADLRANYRTLRGALDEHYPDSRVHFAVKANYNLGVLSVLRSTGCGAEAYARCELTAALEAGFAPGEVILTGMSRRQADLERAMDAGVDTFLVDNGAELAGSGVFGIETHPRIQDCVEFVNFIGHIPEGVDVRCKSVRRGHTVSDESRGYGFFHGREAVTVDRCGVRRR